jgi:hypothetical protein
MKKFTLLTAMLIFLGISNMLQAQTSPSDKLFEKYNGKEGYTTVSISKELFSMFASLDTTDADAKEMKDMMSQLNYIRIIMYETEKENDAELGSFKEELSKLNLSGFSELMTVNEKGENVKFLALKKGDKIGELLLVINSGKEAGFITINGNIDVNTISKLSKSMHLEGMEQLQKLDEEKK